MPHSKHKTCWISEEMNKCPSKHETDLSRIDSVYR